MTEILGASVTAAVLGVAAHVLYFSRGEHHLYGLRYVEVFFLSFLATTALVRRSLGGETQIDSAPGWSQSALISAGLHLYFLGGLYASCVTYRVLLSPLRRFPGPLDLRISSLSLVFRVRNSDAHKKVQDLHARYGPFVRIGPSALSIIDPAAIGAVHSGDSGFSKGDFYDLLHPAKSLQMMRNKKDHAARRRVWSAAFSDRALRGYEKRAVTYQNKLLARLAESVDSGKPTNVTRWIYAFSFDLTSDLALGKPFGSLDTDKKHWVIDVMDAGTVVLGLMLPTWVFRLLSDIPGLNGDFFKWFNFARDSMMTRAKTKPETPDMASALLSVFEGRDPTAEELALLTGDSQLIIGAGSDTSSSTMTVLLYLLAKHPQELAKLRVELAPLIVQTAPSSAISFSSEKLASAAQLNGIINETLRLYPVVPTATYRRAPPQGVSIAGTFVPGGTDVWTPQYAIGRSEEIYQDPNSFRPERWSEHPELVKDSRAFAPFLIGPFNCIGKPLALQTIRSTIAKIVCTFDISLPPGDDGRAFEAGIKDRWILGVPSLLLKLTKHPE
ncbi:cytochrome P450 [Immersiella caudata]|uniref:Cytochrome P450 n=1 Tax=Immersiella caudata TaxID=314043 RepID=A0AA39WJ92_9PEZI|nr:cytochrome P450 [Immersiella caudata]